ncbi:hypothetical protein K8I61_19880 [bacterium]|nr:hypothetical protein [bacterium]
MPSQIIFVACASIAFACLVAHAIARRGLKTGLVFFVALFAFGILRGNLVHIITSGRTPYVFDVPILRLGYTGPVEAAGWCISLYISWCLAERLLARRGDNAKNVFAVLFMACAMMMAFAVMMEAAAGRLDWWKWRPPRGMRESPALRDVQRGVTEWFSVGFDFLLPYLLIAQTRWERGAWRALFGLIPFPFHFGMHEIRRTRLDDHLIKLNHLSHFVMLAVATLAPYFLFLPLKNVPDFAPPAARRARWIARLDLVGLAIVVMTVIGNLIFVAGEAELIVFAIPLAAFGFYAWWWSERN